MSKLSLIHKYMKDKPVQSFLIIVISILLVYFIYTKFFKKEYLEMETSNTKNISGFELSSYSSLLILCLIIPYIILYYIIKIANKNAIIETSQHKKS